MINPTSSSDRVLRPDGVVRHTSPKAERENTAKTDSFSPDNTDALREALARQPASRPEMVELGRKLAADPSYPSTKILRKVSEIILRSPDLTQPAE